MKSTIQAFYGADNSEQISWSIEPGKVSIWKSQYEFDDITIQMDRIAARYLANAIIRELDKQS